MFALRPLIIGALFTSSAGLIAADRGQTRPAQPPFRLSGSVDWEYVDRMNTQGSEQQELVSFVQKYSLGIDGFVWDPRFNRSSLWIDFLRDDGRLDGEQLDSDNHGYRILTTFFPGRTFPFTLYARRFQSSVGALDIEDTDRETKTWGAEWSLSNRWLGSLHALFDRTNFDLLSPVELKERRETQTLDLSKRQGNNDLTFRYNFQDQQERINEVRFVRRDFSFIDRVTFDNGGSVFVNTTHSRSGATFSTGERDDLTTTRLFSNLDLPVGERTRLGFSLDHSDNDGRFTTATSDIITSRARFQVTRRWELNASGKVGRIDSSAGALDQRQDLVGGGGGVRYTRGWGPLNLVAGYDVGYDHTAITDQPDLVALNQSAELDGRWSVTSKQRIFGTVSIRRDDNDTSGVGFSLDDNRLTLGWEGWLGSLWRGRASIFRRDTVRDTFQFGVQDTTEHGLEGSFNHPRGSLMFSVALIKGISDFTPDLALGSVFQPGTDLVNKATLATIGANVQLWRGLRFQVQGRVEHRDFETIGQEDVLSLHPRLDYTWRVWGLSAELARYERHNGTEFTDRTFRLKISRRF
ncbi:MAG: hypothetical protein ACE5HU_03705 [Acidobacteriota bacterium]